jgi:hypothetical protein
MTNTSSATLLELASRAEATSGPDRELDALIWCALRGVKYKGHNMAYASYGASNPETQVEFTEPPKRTRLVSGNVRWPHATPVTSSIDAAMTLVPEGHVWEIMAFTSHASTRVFRPAGAGGRGTHRAVTPALALVAASLRALASGERT